MRLFPSLLVSFFVILLQRAIGEKSPVILIPGDGGSQLEAILNKSSAVHYICDKSTKDYFNIWLNLELLVPIVIDCWVDNTKLNYDNVTRKTSNQPGVNIRVPKWGDPEPVEWIDPSHASAGGYFKDIANTLVSIGYVRNISLRGAPYDFRRAPNEHQEFFNNLKTLVEETYNINNETRVTFLTHSMGGLMALHFLQRQDKKWKDKYMRQMVTLGAPWGGAVKAVKAFAIGDNLGSYVLQQSILREQQITSPSLSWLLPSPLFWKENEILVQTDKFNYTMENLKQFFIDLNWINGWEMRKDTEQYAMDFSSPGIELHCVHGTDLDTIDRLFYKPGVPLTSTPTFIMGNGDGTVNIKSLEGCLHWSHPNYFEDTITVNHVTIPKAEHVAILSDSRTLDYIKKLFG